MLETLVSLLIANLVFVAAPSLRKDRVILEEDKSVIGKGYPYEYFDGEILTPNDVGYRFIILRAQVIFLSQLYSCPASLAPSIQSGSQLSMGLPVPVTMAPANRDLINQSSFIHNDLIVVFESYNLNAEEQQVVADLMNCCLAGYLTPDQVGTCLKLRGGDDGLVQFLVRILWLWIMAGNLGQTKGFQPIKPIYPGVPGQGQPYPRIAAKVQKNPINRNNPRSLGCQPNQNNQDGTLTKEQRRNLPSPDDLVISEENVIIRDGQAKHKIKNHGYDFGIPSTQNPSGKFKTEKTRENIEAFKKEIKNVVLSGERIEGTYRSAESNGYAAIHFYDPETGRNVIFKKETKEFVSGWILSEGQIQDLLTNGNIGDY